MAGGSSSTGIDADFPRRIQQIEALVQQLEQAPDPRLRERAQELVRVLLDLHKAGLAKVLEVISRSADGSRMIDELAADDLAANLLLLHDLHPIPLEARVQLALDGVQARAARHGATVTMLENHDGRVLVRIQAGTGCGSSADTIRPMVEEALYARAPDLAQLEFEAADPPPAVGFVPLQQLKSHRAPAVPPPSEPVVELTAARPR